MQDQTSQIVKTVTVSRLSRYYHHGLFIITSLFLISMCYAATPLKFTFTSNLSSIPKNKIVKGVEIVVLDFSSPMDIEFDTHDIQGDGVRFIILGEWRVTKFRGIQLGGLVNICAFTDGLQLASVWSVGSVHGVQLGLATYGSNLQGMQIGVVNITTDGNSKNSDISYGAQIGVYNESEGLRGLQLGLINICQSLKGAQIGFINLSKKGGLPMSLGLNIVF